MSDSILDKALGLVSSIQEKRMEGRNDLMRTILPEVLQPEELKQASAPMKEEASKTLHAPKYDRRMKFNTALERSGHKATSEEPVKVKEDPAWLKEAAEKIAISEELAIRALTRATEGATDAASAFKAINKYPRINLRAQGVADPAIRREALPYFKEYTEAASQVANPAALTPEMSESLFSRLFSSQNRLGEILGKQASDPAFNKEAASPEELQRRQAVNLIMLEYLNNPNASTKKRDGTSVIDLQQLPEEHQAQIQKAFKGLRFAPKQASDPAFDFAGVTGREGVVTVEDELERTPPLPIEEPLEYDVGNKPVMQKESAIDLPVDNGIFSVAEPTASEKALPIIGGLSAGILPMAGAFFNPNPSLKSLGVAGLASAGFGLGTYGLLRHRQNKHREQAQKFVDRLNAVARSPMEDFARAEIENVNKTAAGVLGGLAANKPQPWEQ